jgi:hypothetical protein
MKTALAFVAGVMLCLVLAIPASAGGATTMTVTAQNQSRVIANDPPLCGSAPGLVTLTYNSVFHFTVQPDGHTFSDTGTMAGTFALAPYDAKQPSVSGHISDWFGDHGVATFDPNGGGPLNGTDTSMGTMNLQGRYSTGATFDAHAVMKGVFNIVDGNFVFPPVETLIFRATC